MTLTIVEDLNVTMSQLTLGPDILNVVVFARSKCLFLKIFARNGAKNTKGKKMPSNQKIELKPQIF